MKKNIIIAIIALTLLALSSKPKIGMCSPEREAFLNK